MTTAGENLELRQENGIGTILFSSTKANSLSLELLERITQAVGVLSSDSTVRTILLRSEGEATFCAGASFDEFKRISTLAESEQFFMGFAKVILAMRRSPKLIVARVQGKAVGGGVGLIAAADYACAAPTAAARLTEYELGIGPFTIGPAVERKLGLSAFSAMSIDCSWRDSEWLLQHGLFCTVSRDSKKLDTDLQKLLHTLGKAPFETTRDLKRMFWHGTDDWETLLPERAKISGRLLMAARAAGSG